jgi:hypothetical protein
MGHRPRGRTVGQLSGKQPPNSAQVFASQELREN